MATRENTLNIMETAQGYKKIPSTPLIAKAMIDILSFSIETYQKTAESPYNLSLLKNRKDKGRVYAVISITKALFSRYNRYISRLRTMELNRVKWRIASVLKENLYRLL